MLNVEVIMSKFNRTVLLLLFTIVFPIAADAATTVFRGVDNVCGTRIVEAVSKAASARYSPETMETFSVLEVQLNTMGFPGFNQIRLFNVTSSDEVGKTLWLVVTDDKNCVIEYVGVGTEE